MVAWKKESPRPGRNIDSPRLDPYEYVREAATQVHLVGAPVVTAAGVTSECASDPATIDGIAKRPGRNLASADASGDPKLPIIPLTVGSKRRITASVKEALSTIQNGTKVGFLKEGSDWVFSTTCVNKKFTVRFKDPLAAEADTYARVEAEYTG